jgi:hypothetical protein
VSPRHDRIRAALTVALALAAACGDAPTRANDAFLDWTALRNPILALERESLKDVAVAYDEAGREFFLFTSVRRERDDPELATAERSFFRSKDLKRFERFADPDVNGPGYGPGSPDVSFLDGLWHMVWQAESGRGEDARILRVATSPGLVDWSAPRELAPQLLDPALRNIDGALARHDGYFYLGWKRVQDFYVTRSIDRALDGRWLPAQPASAAGAWAENFQFLSIDGVWHMVATAWDPRLYRCTERPEFIVYTCNHEPFLYRMDGDGSRLEDWTRWVDKRFLDVPFEGWNTIMHANSAYLADWRRYDGHFYLFYAGANDGDSFDLRGHGKIGVARSRDLIEWRVAGDPG